LRTSRVAIALLTLAAAGCKRELITIPATPEQLVVHGVLNPADTMQIVLIERTLTGAVGTPVVLPFDPAEPIYSDWGVAERAATTEIVAPDGTVTPGTEYSECYLVPPILCGGNGAGVYKFFLKGSSLVPGGKYTFHATTTKGEIISAETTIPLTPLVTATAADTFNRSVDTLSLSWPSSPRAPAYQVRVENPDGAWSSFTDSTRVALTGGLRNPDETRLPHVFIPGLRQLVTVTAVDANMYDYYRTSNNSFVGYGAVSRVSGAYGVFGSAVTVVRRNITVIANQTQPVEGVWDAIDSGLGYIYFTNHLNVYVESPAAHTSDADAISGNYYNNPAFPSPMSGTFKDGRLALALGTGNNGETLTLQLRGDTLVGQYSKGAPAKFVKAAK
jgi:hypothetical protein